MPNTQSAAKRLRQNETIRLRNRSARSNMRNTIRRVRAAITAGDATTAQAEFRNAVKKLDKAAAKNMIHKNTAARTKSRLNAAVKKIATAS